MRIRRALLAAFVFCILLVGTVALAAEKSETGYLLERAKNLYGVGDYARAVTLFRRTLQHEPDNSEAMDFTGWCYRYLGDWGSAEKTFLEAKPRLPGFEGRWVQAGLGETYLGSALFQKSADAFIEAIALAPDDEELLIRCLKGLALAYASLGDEEKMLEAIGQLSEKSKNEAEQLLPDSQFLLAEAVKMKGSEEDAAPKVTNAEERQVAHILAEDDAADAPSAPEDKADLSTPENAIEAKAQDRILIWGFPLGERMETVVRQAAERGVSVVKFDEPTEFGQWIHVFDYPGKSPLPNFLTQKADFVGYALDEYDQSLLEVRAVVVWRKIGNPILTKNNMFEGLLSVLVKNYGQAMFIEDRGIFSEAFWMVTSRHAVALYASAGLDGSVHLELGYKDIPLCRKYWEYIESQGKEL